MRFLAIALALLVCLAAAGCKTQSADRATHRAPFNSMTRWHCLYCDMEYSTSGTCCGEYKLVPVGGR